MGFDVCNRHGITWIYDPTYDYFLRRLNLALDVETIIDSSIRENPGSLSEIRNTCHIALNFSRCEALRKDEPNSGVYGICLGKCEIENPRRTHLN
jgi:hypothetical protein